ncbi:MAG: putative protease SohB [Candidatus Celerinatantimonas neptuna]|nr:MAG: putative protease SohB [Candidatus Celerinatantimonas neptuna]
MDFLYNLGLFLGEAVIIVVAIGAIVLILLAASMKSRHKSAGLIVDDLSSHFSEIEEQVSHDLRNKGEQKAHQKALKAQRKKEKKQSKEDETKLYVIDFKGSIDAKEVGSLREEVTAVLAVAKPTDEVLVRLESGGGMVHSYGLAASQLARLRSANIPLTIAVDKVAASGGYMMASIGNKILAAPFAIVGSIGVVAQLPNFHRLLKKNDIDYEQLTAGKYKRTITMFGENTDEGREKFRDELEDAHGLFKSFISEYRPGLDIESVATGEHWYGRKAIELGLVDTITTSDDYLMQRYRSVQVLRVQYLVKKKLTEKLGHSVSAGVEKAFTKIMSQSKWDWLQ